MVQGETASCIGALALISINIFPTRRLHVLETNLFVPPFPFSCDLLGSDRSAILLLLPRQSALPRFVSLGIEFTGAQRRN